MASLFFLGKYDECWLLWSFCQTVFDILFRCCVLTMLIAWSVLTWHHVGCSFIRRLTILPVSPMYTCPQEQNILYTPAELSGGLWSLGFFKICPIFLDGLENLKIVWILCLFNILPIRSVVPLTYGRIDPLVWLCVRNRCLVCMFDCFHYVFFVVSVFL